MEPLFLFSLPRSGSTLLQRVLAADSQISTVAEPWILLPLVYALKEQGILAEYSHYWANFALKDFIRELPNGKQDYMSAIRQAVLTLYDAAGYKDGARYFLDKTPRYALIADDIMEVFPEGKFIFLWRNPLAIISSIVETWGGGRWDLSMCEVDLFDGMSNLIDSCVRGRDRALMIQYEHFSLYPEQELSKIAAYLGIDFSSEVLNDFSRVGFKGALGDPTGTRKYGAVDAAPLEKWKTVINNPLRKRWCRRYLLWLGEERLKVMGYDLNELMQELDAVPMKLTNLLSDVLSKFYPRVRPELPCKLHF